MGLMSRVKGKAFERKVAAMLRERWPNVIVRRASQAERADNPDVFCEGEPLLERLWLELEDSQAPQPENKLEQAERDVREWQLRRSVDAGTRLPVVVWHRIRERTIWVTTRLWVVDELRGGGPMGAHVVTFDLDTLLALLSAPEAA